MSRSLQIAHRGGTGLWPENTLEAFERAIDLGVDGIELDAHLSADGQLVVHHDARLNPAIAREPGGAWLDSPTPLLKLLSAKRLREYDVGRLRPGSPYAARHPQQTPVDSERIPLLEDVYHLVRNSARADFKLYVELKTSLHNPAEAADPLALAAAAVALTQRMELAGSVIFASVDWRALVRVRELAPEISIAFTTPAFALLDPQDGSASNDPANYRQALMRQASAAGAPWFAGLDWRDQAGRTFAERIFQALATSQADGWFAWHGDVTEETLALARELELEIACWTVDDPAEMTRLAALGVDAILSDRPDILAATMSDST